ncbi:MAG: hypothetical protein EXS05_23135 [Planctomycetaceae bacterium]|nr:hypothetical protein [Planctomycetaceae bacterium]
MKPRFRDAALATEFSGVIMGVSIPFEIFGERLRSRLAPGQGERPGRPSDPNWTVQRKLSMNSETLASLERIAEALSTDERRVSPMQVAALLVEDAAEHLLTELIEH